MNAPPPPPIQNYSLYGESELLADVLHCETIAQRSVLHDWELAPHRHDHLHQLVLLRSGGGSTRLEGRELALPPMSLVNVAPGDVHAFTFEPGTLGLVVTLTDTLRDELLAHDPEPRRLLGSAWVGEADGAVVTVMEQLAQEYTGRSTARGLLLRGLAATLLGHAVRAAERLAERGAPLHFQRAEPHLLKRFETLLESHFRDHWTVADYAAALAISPTHLSRVVRGALGVPASRLIDARVVREARRHLAYTHLAVASIGYALGFSDPALFSRVFSRVTGCSPRTYRHRLEASRASPPPA